MDSLKANYKDFLFKLQPATPMSDSSGIEFVDDLEKSQRLARCFNFNLEQEGIDQLIIAEDSTLQNPLVEIATIYWT
jgi:hypothetical protein